jgi:hypothetical protein
MCANSIKKFRITALCHFSINIIWQTAIVNMTEHWVLTFSGSVSRNLKIWEIFDLDSKYHLNISGLLPRFANNNCKHKENHCWSFKFNYELPCELYNFPWKFISLHKKKYVNWSKLGRHKLHLYEDRKFWSVTETKNVICSSSYYEVEPSSN